VPRPETRNRRKGIKTFYYIRVRQMALKCAEVEARLSCML
jgi:hypothetical protein